MRAFFLGRVSKERGTSFDVSNLGVMRIVEGDEKQEGDEKEKGDENQRRDEKQRWKMGKVVFSRSAFVSGSAIAAGVVTGADGCLTIGFCWQEGVVERGLVEMMVERVRAGVGNIADEMGG